MVRLNSISDYRQVSDLINTMNGTKDDMQVQKDQLLSLFEGSFLKMGANSNEAKIIGEEIEEIEALIAKEKAQMKVWERAILEDQEQIGQAQEALEDYMAEYLKNSEAAYQETRNSIQEVTRDVIHDYAMGAVKKEDVSKEIQNRIAAKAPEYNLDMTKINQLSGVIQDRVDNITNLVDQMNMHNAKLSTSYAALQLLNEMYQMQMELPTGKQVTEKAGRVPVYTPEKQALVDQFYARYHATATAGVDQFSISNVQVRNIGSAIGCGTSDATTDTGVYTLYPENNTADTPEAQRTNLYPGSILQDMFNAGFTYKEAMYACQYIFGTSNNLLSYDLSNDVLVLGWGHMAANSGVSYANCDARTILNSFNNQARALWGRDRSVPPSSDEPGHSSSSSRRTDPIGWTEGNVTFDFVVDRNGNNRFDDENEFLGATNGIDELIAYDYNHDGVIDANDVRDTNGDGKIDENDKNALEELMLLRTDHEVQGFGFLTAKDAGITEINLKSLFNNGDESKYDAENFANNVRVDNVSSPHANINGNEVKNTFGITFNDNSTKTGAQSLDDNAYLRAVYGARFGKDMIVSIDFKKAANAQAKDDIKNFNVSFDQTKIEEAEAQKNAIMNSYKDKKAEVEKEIQAEKRELVQDLNREQRKADTEVDIIEERNTREADDAEYQKRNLEGRLKALENRKSTIETELKNLYNKDEETYNARKAELEADLVSVNQQIADLRQKLPSEATAA